MTSIMKYSISQPPTRTEGFAIATRGFQQQTYGNYFKFESGDSSESVIDRHSIVLGGDTFNPEDRLGPFLEKDLDFDGIHLHQICAVSPSPSPSGVP